MSLHPEIQRVTENNCPLERINPLGKALHYHEKVYWKQQCFHRKSQNTCCKALLKWECSFKCCWLWWGGEAWSLPGAFAFLLSSFVQCLKYSQTLKTSPFCLRKHMVFFSVLGSALQNGSGQHLKAQDVWWQGWKHSVFHCSQTVSKLLLFWSWSSFSLYHGNCLKTFI